MISVFKNKRYKDIFEQYIYKEQKTPLTIGTIVVCGFCFLLLIIATFSECSISIPHLNFHDGIELTFNKINYSPRIPVMIFIIYLLGRNYSLLVFLLYLIIGFFVWPIFVFGGGISYIQNYLFGYFLGFIFAIFISGNILNKSQNAKSKLLAGLFGVLSIHFCGLIYCIILALFGVIKFSIIIPIILTISAGKIIYDLFFSIGVLFIGPYIKNIFWICMKPKPDKKKLKNEKFKNKFNYQNEN